MLVEEAMKTDVITVNKETTIQEAIELLEKHRIRHIPVVEQDHTLTGIVSDRIFAMRDLRFFINILMTINFSKNLFQK